MHNARSLKRVLLLGLLLLLALAAPLTAAINCELNDPTNDVARLFPESTSFKISGFSFAFPGGEPKLRKVESRLGGVPSLYAPLNVPYTLYECYKGAEKIGYVHGVNQKGQFGVLEVFVSLDRSGRIKAFYLQRIAGQWAQKFTSNKFGNQFVGLTLKDFERYDVVSGKGSGKLAAINNPAPEAVTDFFGLLRAVNKNLVLMDEFIYSLRNGKTMISKFQVALKNLLRKKTRTLLTLVGIVLSSWVLVSLLGFNRGYESALNRDIDNMGYQIMVMAKGCPYEAATMMLQGGAGLRYIEQDVVDAIAIKPEVDKVTPILMQAFFDPNKGDGGGIAGYYGIDLATYPGMKPFLKFRKGGWPSSDKAAEAVMGYEAAELEQREVGDMILVPEKNVELKVVGILERTGTQDDGTIFVPLKTLQQISGIDKITTIGIKVKKNADETKLETALYQLPDMQVVSFSQVKLTIMKLIATARVMVLSIAVIALLIAMVGVVNTVLMSVLERKHEIGILKTMGAMPSDIFRLVWTETFILCTCGGILGIALAFVLARLSDLMVRRILPYAPGGELVAIDVRLSFLTLMIIVAVGLLSGVYPAWKAGRVRPLESIRSEG